MSATEMTPLAGTVMRLELPEEVTPLRTHVARTRTRPRLAGTFGSTQTPLASTGAVRLKALTMHDESSWAAAGIAEKTANKRLRRLPPDIRAMSTALFPPIRIPIGFP